MEVDGRLDMYERRGGRNKVIITQTIKDQLERSAMRELHANNVHSRIAFANAAAGILKPIMLAETRPIFWVTLINEEHAPRFSDALTFKLQRFQSWVRRILPHVHIIGMVDIGCYPVPHGTYSLIRPSFHGHMLCWGVTEEDMADLGARINERYSAYIKGRPSFHARRVPPDWANKLVFYMCKHPLKSSRFLRKLAWIDVDTGEIRERGQDRMYEERITTGRAVRVAMLMERHRLSDVMFGAGEGVAIRKRIIAKACDVVDREWGNLPLHLRR